MVVTLQTLILLLLVIAAVAVVARRIRVPPAILLVLVGLALAVVPGLPAMELAPQLVLLVILPPVIYWSGVTMSWREFRANLQPISLLAVGCVVFTTVAVAIAAHELLNFPWAVGFVLGAIVSPPDEIAPLAIARRLGLPVRLLVIIEGEGLANDASSLVLYRFAVAAVSTEFFSFGAAAAQFAVIAVGETLWGVAVGWVMLRLRARAHDTHVEMLLSVLTAYAAYWPPLYLGGSGVLAAVAAGLYVSWNGSVLISPATRLQGIFFWDFFTYLIEGMVFLITGLQARTLLARFSHTSISDLVIAAAIICAVVIAARFVWVFPATYVPRWLIPSLRRKGPPPWQNLFGVSFMGVRGLVSLAIALAVPLTTATGQPFPNRDLILFLTFVVILVTLVGQGLTLPLVIRGLGLAKAGRSEMRHERDQEAQARRLAIEAALARLDAISQERQLTEELLVRFRRQYAERLQLLDHRGSAEDGKRRLMEVHDEVQFALINAERATVNTLYRANKLSDEARRRLEHELDLRVAQLSKVRESYADDGNL